MPPHWARRDPALAALINAGVPGWLDERPGWPGGKDNLALFLSQRWTGCTPAAGNFTLNRYAPPITDSRQHKSRHVQDLVPILVTGRLHRGDGRPGGPIDPGGQCEFL